MKIAAFQKSSQNSTPLQKVNGAKKRFSLLQIFLITIIIVTIGGIIVLSRQLQKEKVTEKTKALEPTDCGITLNSKYLDNGKFWFSVAPQDGPVNIQSIAFVCSSTKNADGKNHCDGTVESFVTATRPINYEKNPTPLISTKEFTIDVPCNGIVQVDFWKVSGTADNYQYQDCNKHLYEPAPQCENPTLPPTIPPTVPATLTPIPPTLPPSSTITPIPPTVPPTSPPSSTATPQPTSSACIQVIPNIPQGVGIEIINNNQCKFSWNEVSNVTGYQISWGENPNGEGKPNVNLGKLLTYTFDCPDLTTKTYYFKVRAMNECAEGTFSNIVHAGSWPTPTEIILAKTTSGATAKPITPSIPSAGVAQFGFLLIPLGIIIMALIL